MTNLACVLWWLVPGMFAGWLLSWVFDLLFGRNGVPLLETAKAEAASAQARVKGFETELVASRADASRHANDVKRLSADLTNVRSSHDQAQGSLGLLKTEIDERNASLAKYTTDFSALQGQYSTAQQSHAQLEAALAASKTEAQAAHGKHEVVQRNLEGMQRDLAAAKSEIAASKNADSQHSAAASGEIAKLREELTAAHSARDHAKQSLSLIETERSQVKNSLADLGGEADGLRGELAKLKAQLAGLTTAQEENGQLKDQLASVNKQMSSLRDVAGGHETFLGKAAREADQLNADLVAARAKAAKLELAARDHTALIRTHEEHKLAFGKLRIEDDDKAKLIALLQADIAGNKRNHEALSGRVSDIERVAQLAAERRVAMTRYGFVSRTRDRDDLTLVEGIGPKIEELLLVAGVDTHAKLAVTPVEDVRAILDKAGPSFKIANPGTWPRQAAFIVRNDWAELRRWQDVLIAGVEVPSVTREDVT